MKIKTQFTILIFAIAMIPLAVAVSLPVYHYLTSPQRYLMKGFREVSRLNKTNLTSDELDEIRSIIKSVPPNVQVAIYSEHSIIISNIPELRAGTECSLFDIITFMSDTSGEYDYQMQELHSFLTINSGKTLVISRAPVSNSKNRRKSNYMMPAFILMLLFETICIALTIALSRTIFSSIQLLEANTQKIANGELDTKLELPQKSRDTNEITSLAENLDRMRGTLKDNQERRNKFIMGISHDLRTPVALIKGYSEAISDGVVSDMDSIKKSLSIVETKAEQLETMINDLINYMKLNTNEWRQHLAQISIKPVLDEFVSSAVETADVYKRKTQATIHVEESATVFMDKNLFTRALENLYNNALRYTKENDSIYIRAEQSGDRIKISIEDTGIGIEEKDLAHIYDIFYRGTSSRREQGMGVGLSVVKTVIDSHGWDIDVKSEVNVGTTFTITIPISVPQKA